jgi:hypothetical protein
LIPSSLIPHLFHASILFPALLGFHRYVLRSSPIRGQLFVIGGFSSLSFFARFFFCHCIVIESIPFLLYLFFDECRFLYDIGRIVVVMNLVNSPPPSVEAFPLYPHADLTPGPEAPKFVDFSFWNLVPRDFDGNK